MEVVLACHTTDASRSDDVRVIGNAVAAHICCLHPGNSACRQFGGWVSLLGSDSLQRYAMGALGPVPPPSQAPPSLPAPRKLSKHKDSFVEFLSLAAGAGQMSSARLSDVTTHSGILASLRAAAAGRGDVNDLHACTNLLNEAWKHIARHGRDPGGSPEAHAAMQSALLAAMQQGIALLQLRAVAPAQQERGVRRARKEGFLQARPSTLVLVPAP